MTKRGTFRPSTGPDVSCIVEYFQREVPGPVSTIIRKDNSPGKGSTFIVDSKTAFQIRKVDESGRPLVSDQIRQFAVDLGVDQAFAEALVARGMTLEQAERDLILQRASELSSSRNSDPFEALSIDDLGSYIFDPDANAPAEDQFYRGLLSRSDLCIWIGQEKHRKSNFILQLAICAAVGRDFLGFKFESSEPLRVILVDYETKTASLKKRLDGITKALNLNKDETAILRPNFKVIEVKRVLKSGHVFPKFPHTARTPANQNGNSDDVEFWQRLVSLYPADLYIVDPMRSMHSGDENDSRSETLLSEMRRVFRNAAVITAHHMRKSSEESTRSLRKDMRAWSDGARGSSALKAHADVILCQERITDDHGDEVIYLGAFLKDGADVDPFPSMETDHESYFFQPTMIVSDPLRKSFDALRTAGGTFTEKAAAVQVIRATTGAARTTAYRHVDQLIRAGLLIEKPNSSVQINPKAVNGG
jgi:hypothetical protein